MKGGNKFIAFSLDHAKKKFNRLLWVYNIIMAVSIALIVYGFTLTNIFGTLISIVFAAIALIYLYKIWVMFIHQQITIMKWQVKWLRKLRELDKQPEYKAFHNFSDDEIRDLESATEELRLMLDQRLCAIS